MDAHKWIALFCMAVFVILAIAFTTCSPTPSSHQAPGWWRMRESAQHSTSVIHRGLSCMLNSIDIYIKMYYINSRCKP